MIECPPCTAMAAAAAAEREGVHEGMRAALERDGFVLIRGIVPPELLRDVQGVVEAAVEQRASDLLERGLVSSTHAGEPFETRWQAVVDESGAMQARRSWDEDLISPQFHRLCSAPALSDPIQSMLGSDSEGGVYCTGNFSLRPKIPNDKRTTIKWHNVRDLLPSPSPSLLIGAPLF